ncbi:unnamed protein product [Bursaphelenchus okinawaensis]|uniref:Uncharacterized protein n=1 Tax=Bursaphelenchus okinawaensis TaxID=465554 RepID=A0A811KSI9_9BILA|nr:unnamed protein product [Bursaphelenchus okinawaensis]CAG9111604.1 unnamed protein product [Bursaphelenchus okinawaensis]
MLKSNKTSVTKSITSLNEVLTKLQEPVKCATTRLAVVELLKRKSSLEDAISRSEAKLQLLLSCEGVDKDVTIDDYVNKATEAIEEGFSVNRELKALIIEREQQVAEENEARRAGNPTTVHQEVPKLQFRTPKFNLPVFDGEDHTKWPSFAQTFEAYVKSTNFTPFEKITVLKECLQGKARLASEVATLECNNTVINQICEPHIWSTKELKISQDLHCNVTCGQNQQYLQLHHEVGLAHIMNDYLVPNQSMVQEEKSNINIIFFGIVFMVIILFLFKTNLGGFALSLIVRLLKTKTL